MRETRQMILNPKLHRVCCWLGGTCSGPGWDGQWETHTVGKLPSVTVKCISPWSRLMSASLESYHHPWPCTAKTLDKHTECPPGKRKVENIEQQDQGRETETCMRPFRKVGNLQWWDRGKGAEALITGGGKPAVYTSLIWMKPFQKIQYLHQQYKSLLNSLSRELCCYSTDSNTLLSLHDI